MNFAEMHKLRPLYLDGELTPEDTTSFEAHLRDCVDCRNAFERECALRSALKQGLRHYHAPSALLDRLRRDLTANRAPPLSKLRLPGRGWNALAIAASLLLTFIAGSGVTTLYFAMSADERVVAEVISSHRRSLMADHLIDIAASDGRQVTPWFRGKAEAAPPAVDLAAAGYPLIGARVDYVDNKHCAILVYRHDRHVINVLVWADQGGAAKPSEFYARQGLHLVHFAEDAMDFWAVSDIDQTGLSDFTDRLIKSTHAAKLAL